MKRAFLQLRFSMPERIAMFQRGLTRLGYTVFAEPTRDPREGDVLVTWNRIRDGHQVAQRFTQHGGRVIVTENATWGNDFAGDRWLTLVRDFHNQRGNFLIGGSERWDSLHVELDPWRRGGETVLLPQRGIGPPGIAMPLEWVTQYRGHGRVRQHPGTNACKPLREDLAQCDVVRTWGSGAAVLACMWGIAVLSDLPNWIGEHNATDEDRLRMLRELAWAQARHSEIETGAALERLLR